MPLPLSCSAQHQTPLMYEMSCAMGFCPVRGGHMSSSRVSMHCNVLLSETGVGALQAAKTARLQRQSRARGAAGAVLARSQTLCC